PKRSWHEYCSLAQVSRPRPLPFGSYFPASTRWLACNASQSESSFLRARLLLATYWRVGPGDGGSSSWRIRSYDGRHSEGLGCWMGCPRRRDLHQPPPYLS